MNRIRTRRALQQGEAHPASVLLLFLILAISWVLWSGLYKPLLLGLGVFSCAITVYVAHRMGSFRHQAMFGLLPRLPRYWAWLLREIATSSLTVAKLILQPSMPISPTVVILEAQPKTEGGQVILGNSITLSPGTFTLDIHEGKLLVHCLLQESAQELQNGEVNRRAAALERS